MNLQGKTVAITGAAGGIGSALAREFAEAGARLVLTDRDAAALASLAAETGGAALAGDVLDPALPDQLIVLARERFGEPDVLVNGAGIMTIGPIDTLDLDRACLMVRINLEALVRFSYVFARAMKTRKEGFLVNISSIAGYRTQATMGVYDASKHGVEVFTDALRIELAGTGVRVAAVAPGTVDTGLYKDWAAGDRDYVYSGGALRPQDVARTIRTVIEQPDSVLLTRIVLVTPAFPV